MPSTIRPDGTQALDGLTALRFFAALMVILFHYFNQYLPGAAEQHGLTPLISHGFTGVTFFFMLSGFILSYTYARTDFRRPASVVRYLQARFARIMPLYLLSLAVAAPFYIDSVLHSRPGPYLTLYGMASVLAPLGLQAWVPGAAGSINFPSWSVSNEEVFYLLFPLLLPALMLRPVRWLVLAGLYMAAVWGATIWLWQEFGGGTGLMESSKASPDGVRLAAQFIKFFPLCHAHEFVLGMLLYLLWERIAWRWPGWLLLLGGFGLFLAMVEAAGLVPGPVFHNGLMTLPFALLILGGANLRSGGGTLLVFLGKASYGMYLFHVPLYQSLRWLDQAAFQGALMAVPFLCEFIVLAAVVAVASWLHLAFEEPLRRRIMRWRWQPQVRDAV